MTACRRPSSLGVPAFIRRLAGALATGAALLLDPASAAELTLIAPNAVKDTVVEIASRFQRETGHRVLLSWGGSESIARRVADGESFDVVVNTAPGVERLAADGHLVAGTRTAFARSGIGVAVRSGRPRPDVSSVEALRRTLLAAPTIAISSGASGRYLEQLFERLGVADQVRGRIRQPPSGASIAEWVARGDAELGFQQVTELAHAAGIDYLGPLPGEVQSHTVWTAARHAGSVQADVADAFLRALVGTASAAAVRGSGMDVP